MIDVKTLEIAAAKAGRSDNDGLPAQRGKYTLHLSARTEKLRALDRSNLTAKQAKQLSKFSAEQAVEPEVPAEAQPAHLVERAGNTLPPSPHVHVREYCPPSWFSAVGVAKKRRQIERRGLPNFHQWRFITLTIKRERFENALDAYLAGKEQMRRFMTAARKAGLWKVSTKWAWKLEFHRDGWPHWHLLVGRIDMFTEAELKLLDKLWALGFTSTEMVRNDDFVYSFKYAFKAVLQRDEETDEYIEDASVVPDWFLDYSGYKTVSVKHHETGEIIGEAMKPVTFMKVRFWQTSKDFYTGERPQEDKERKTQVTWVVPHTARTTYERSQVLIQVVARKRNGLYQTSGIFALSSEKYDLFRSASQAHTYDDGLALGVNNYFMPVRQLNKHINENEKWKLQPLLDQNRLQLLRASRLQMRGKCWKTS